MVTAQEVTTFFAAIAAVVVGGPAASPGFLLRLPTSLFCLVRLGGSQQSLDLLHTHTNGVCAHSELPARLLRHPPLSPLLSFFLPSRLLPESLSPRNQGEPTLTVFLQHNNENSFFQKGRIRVGGWGEGARFPVRHFLVWTVGDSKARLGRGLKPGTRTCWGKHKGANKKGVGRPAGATRWSGLLPRESKTRAAGR